MGLNFSGANFSTHPEPNPWSATISGGSLSGANFEGVIFPPAIGGSWVGDTIAVTTDLTGVSFRGVPLRRVFNYLYWIDYLDLVEEVKASFSDFSWTTFDYIYRGSIGPLEARPLSKINFSNATLDYATWKAGGRDMNFTNASLVGFAFTGQTPACGTGTSMANDEYCPGFVTSNFTGANLTGSNLSLSSFRESNFTNANFSGANLSGAWFGGATGLGTALVSATTICPSGSLAGSLGFYTARC